MNHFSISQWIFGNEPLEESFKRLQKFGYDGIELAGEPDFIDKEEILRLLRKYNLICTSICGIFTPKRDLSASDSETAADAICYLKKCVDMASFFGAATIIVVPSPVGKTAFAANETYLKCWDNAVINIRKAADYAALHHVTFVIEAVNRYETCLVHNLTQALRLAEEINHPAVGLMADLFHMNLEERSFSESIYMIRHYLRHVHIADNTREAAGMGFTDFPGIFRTLKDLSYAGSYTMEFLPPISNPYEAALCDTKQRQMDIFADTSIRYIKSLL